LLNNVGIQATIQIQMEKKIEGTKKKIEMERHFLECECDAFSGSK